MSDFRESGGRPQQFTFEPNRPNFNAKDDAGHFAIHIDETMALQASKLAEHEGRLQGLATALAVIQNSLSFWQAAALGIAGLALAAMALIVSLQLDVKSDVSDLSKDTARATQKVAESDARLQGVDARLQALPAAVSGSVREVARDLVVVRSDAREEAEHRRSH